MPSKGLRLLLSLLLCVALAAPAVAARFHVQPGGTRTAGPSVPENWSGVNCYATLAAAVAQAAPADTVLLQRTIHVVDEEVDLAVALVSERDLTTAPLANLDLTSEGTLRYPAGHAALEVRGLTCRSAGDMRTLPAMIGVDGVDLTVVGCRFLGFTAPGVLGVGGGALRIDGGGQVLITDCLFADNTSESRGGALYLGGGLMADIEDCTFRNNAATAFSDPRGGGVMIDSRFERSTVTFRGCEWRDNTSGGPGGALATISADVTLEDCGIYGSQAGTEIGWSEGAGLHFRRIGTDHGEATPATVRRCEFFDNAGVPDIGLNAGDGGAVQAAGIDDVRRLDLLIEDSVFGNNFNLQGGGVYVGRFAEGTVQRCRFFDNIAFFQGGAVFKGGQDQANIGETLYVDTSLFVGNRAGFDADGQPTGEYCRGGAVACRMFPRIEVRHSTFIDNAVASPGYQFGDAFAHYYEYDEWQPDMLCVLQNTVFWGEGGGDVQAYSSTGGMATVENNAAAAGELDLGGVVEVGTVVLTASPFTSLDTGFPSADGPLIDAGIDLRFEIDLLGHEMPVGDAPDIGCYEWYDVVAVEDLPVATVQLVAGPNPFNPRTVLSCRLDRPAGVQLVLHDARGRQVRRLWTGPLPAGDHRWTWDGRDESGRECSSGVYLAQLVVDDGRMAVTKLTLVR
jgi:predicted outer membrane repeat protein